MIVCLRNRTQKEDDGKTLVWQGYYLRLFRDPHLTILCYGLLQKDLFKGRSSLENNFFKHDPLMIVVIIVTQGLPSSFPCGLPKYLTFRADFHSRVICTCVRA